MIFPATIRQGDTISHNIPHYSNYTADTYTFAVILLSSTNRYHITASPNGLNYTLSVPSTSTGLWTPGVYKWIGQYSYGNSVYSVYAGTTEILPGFSTIVDTRSHAKKMLDAIEAVLEGRASDDVQQYQVSFGSTSKSISKIPIEQLLVIRDRFKAEYKRELMAENIKNGIPVSTNIKVRFV